MSAHLDLLVLQRLGMGEAPALSSEDAAHLAACASCRRQVEGWRRLAAALDRLSPPPSDPAFVPEVLARLDAVPEGPSVGALRRWALGLVAFSLGTVLLAGAGAGLLDALPVLLARAVAGLGALLATVLSVGGAILAALPAGWPAAVLVMEAATLLVLFRVFSRLFAPRTSAEPAASLPRPGDPS